MTPMQLAQKAERLAREIRAHASVREQKQLGQVIDVEVVD
jgi:hypothetical protein